MDGSAELLQLADLLRVRASAARDLNTLRPNDLRAIERLAARADAIAAELEALVAEGEDATKDGAR